MRSTFLSVLVLLSQIWSGGCHASPSDTAQSSQSAQSANNENGPSLAASVLGLPEHDLDRFDERWHARVKALEAEIESVMGEQPMDPGRVGNAFGALGRHYMAHHLVDMATVCFDYAQTVDAEEIRWPYLNGFLHQIQDQYEEAAEDYQSALRIDPQHLEAGLRLGTVWIELGRPVEAEQHLQKILADHPDQMMARYELGRLRLDQGRLPEAIKFLEQVVAAQPSAGIAQYALGQAYRRQGDSENARLTLEKADEQPVVFSDPLLGELAELGVTSEFYRMRAERAMAEGRLADAVSHYGKAVELGDDGFQMRMAYAFVLHQSGDRAKAIEQLESATGGADPNLTDHQRAEAHHRLGLLFAESGDERKSIEHQQAALEQEPSHVGAAIALGDAAARAGRLKDAIERYSSVLSLDAQADHRQALIKRGTALLNTEETEAGLRDLRRALDLKPDDFELYLRWIEAQEHAGSEEAARQSAAELARQMLKDPPEAARGLTVTFTKLGHKLRRYGEIDAAEMSYRRALEPVPETPDLRMNLADLLMIREQFEEARSLYEAVRAMDPEHVNARFGELRCSVSLGEWAKARKGLEESLSTVQSGRLLHLLSRVLALAPSPTGDPERALKIAEEVFNARRTPDHAATLGMALAASGQFEQAVRWYEQLIADTEGLGDPWSRWLQTQLDSYRRQQVWRPENPSHVFSPAQP